MSCVSFLLRSPIYRAITREAKTVTTLKDFWNTSKNPEEQ
jgi:hypothetical protein